MRMIPQEDEVDDTTEVTWEDQQRINTFSKYNLRLQDIEETLEQKKEEKVYLDDVSLELELADEDSPILYKIGDAFVHLPLPRATRLLTAEQASLEQEIDDLKDSAEECERIMKELKVILYAKFGNAINLESGP